MIVALASLALAAWMQTTSAGSLLETRFRHRRNVANSTDSSWNNQVAATTYMPAASGTCNSHVGAMFGEIPSNCSCLMSLEDLGETQCCWSALDEHYNLNETILLTVDGYNLDDLGSSVQQRVRDAVSAAVTTYCSDNLHDCHITSDDFQSRILFLGAGQPEASSLSLVTVVALGANHTAAGNHWISLTGKDLERILSLSSDLLVTSFSMALSAMSNWSSVLSVEEFCPGPVRTAPSGGRGKLAAIVGGAVSGLVVVAVCAVSARKAIVDRRTILERSNSRRDDPRTNRPEGETTKLTSTSQEELTCHVNGGAIPEVIVQEEDTRDEGNGLKDKSQPVVTSDLKDKLSENEKPNGSVDHMSSAEANGSCVADKCELKGENGDKDGGKEIEETSCKDEALVNRQDCSDSQKGHADTQERDIKKEINQVMRKKISESTRVASTDEEELGTFERDAFDRSFGKLRRSKEAALPRVSSLIRQQRVENSDSEAEECGDTASMDSMGQGGDEEPSGQTQVQHAGERQHEQGDLPPPPPSPPQERELPTDT